MKKAARFRKTTFANGLTLVTERLHGFQGLSIGVWFTIGTRHEKAREAGMSHFLEHMLFKGTETLTALDIAKSIDEVGGEINAFTTRDSTCFHVLVRHQDLEIAASVLNDIILNSTFDSQELERERKVILQEISMVEDTPEEFAGDLFFEKVFGRNPLGRSILGSEASIRRLQRGDILRFFKKHYRPENVVISVAGDVSHEQVKKQIRPLIKRNWVGRSPSRPLLESSKPVFRPGQWWMKRATEQVHLIWGVEAPKLHSADRFAVLLMNDYLGGNMSSLLFQEIREKKGLAYTVYSSLSTFSDMGILNIYIGTSPAQTLQCLRLVEFCLDKLKKQLMDVSELDRVRSNIRGTLLLSSDNVESRMSSLATNEIFKSQVRSMDEICAQLDAVTPEAIRRAARKYLRMDKSALMALGPRPPKSVRNRIRFQYLG